MLRAQGVLLWAVTRAAFSAADYGCAPSRPIGLSISDIFAQAGGKIRPFSLKTDPFWLNLRKETYIKLILFNSSNCNPVTNSRGHPRVCSPRFRSSFCSLWASPCPSGPLSPRGPQRRARCWIRPLCWCFLILLFPLRGCFIAISTLCGKHHPRAPTSPKGRCRSVQFCLPRCVRSHAALNCLTPRADHESSCREGTMSLELVLQPPMSIGAGLPLPR